MADLMPFRLEITPPYHKMQCPGMFNRINTVQVCNVICYAASLQQPAIGQQKSVLMGGDHFGEVKFIVKLHFGDIKNWLLKGGGCCWEVTVPGGSTAIIGLHQQCARP